MTLTFTERLSLLTIGGTLLLCAHKESPSSGPVLLAIGYHLMVVLMVTTPDPRR